MPQEVEAEFPAPLPRGHVLLVEDDESSAVYMTFALHQFGCEVTRAIDGADAASAAAVTRFDLILMDYQMPLLDGAHAAALIRSDEARHEKPRVPIVAVTATDRGELCLEAGMDGVLHKPVTLEALEGMLRRWLPVWPQTPFAEERGSQ